MPEQTMTKIAEFKEQILQSFLFSFIGISIGISQLMSAGAKFVWRVWLGRAISTGGLAMSAGAILVWFPSVPLVAQLGIAAALASIGTSGLVHLSRRIIDRSIPLKKSKEEE